MDYTPYLEKADWRKPVDRPRTQTENRAAIAKVDQLVETIPGCTKTQAFCRVGLNFNRYYQIKRQDGAPSTPCHLIDKVRSPNSAGSPGRPKGVCMTKDENRIIQIDTTLKSSTLTKVQKNLAALEKHMAELKTLGVTVRLALG